MFTAAMPAAEPKNCWWVSEGTTELAAAVFVLISMREISISEDSLLEMHSIKGPILVLHAAYASIIL